MKVICINCNEKSDLKPGCIYTVHKHVDHFYLFEEMIETGFAMWYHESQFIPLSEADETDLLIKRKLNK